MQDDKMINDCRSLTITNQVTFSIGRETPGWTPTFGPDAMRQFPSVDVGFLAGLGGGSP